MRSRSAPKNISLAFELHDISEAVEAAHVLLKPLCDGPADAETRAVAGSASAVLTLVGCRIRALLAVVRGQVEPATVWHPGNDAGEVPTDEPGAGDVVLPCGQTKA